MGHNVWQDVFIDWFLDGIHMGARYMLIVFDEYEMEKRPVYIFPEQNIAKEVIKYNQKRFVQGVIDLTENMERQIKMLLVPFNMIKSRVVN